MLGSNQRRLSRRFYRSRIPTIGIAADLRILHSPPLKTAFCPLGVRAPGVCLVSAMHFWIMSYEAPAESYCIQF